MTWERVTLRSLGVEVQTGFASGKHAGDGDVLHLRPMNITPLGTLTLEGGKFVAADAGAQRVRRGDILFNNTNSPKWVGKTAWISSTEELAFSNHMTRLRVSEDRIDSRFLAIYLHHQQSLGYFEAICSNHVNQASVPRKALLQTELPLPPLEEQRRIVTILEDHLSRLAAAESYLSAARRRLAVRQDRLIGRAVTGTDFGAGVATELPAVGTDDGLLPPLPTDWKWARLGDVADVVGGVTKDAKKQNDPGLVEVPYLRVANVQRGHLDLDTVATIRVPPAKAEALRLRLGDVLLNEGGDRDKLARGWVWDGQIDDCIHQNHVFRARITDPRLTPEFLSFTTNSFGGPWAERNGKQSVNLASISLKVIRQMPVIVPSRGEAEAAVSRLTEQLAGTERLRAGIDAARGRCTALRRSLLAAAFSGRLTVSSPEMSVVEGRIEA